MFFDRLELKDGRVTLVGCRSPQSLPLGASPMHVPRVGQQTSPTPLRPRVCTPTSRGPAPAHYASRLPPLHPSSRPMAVHHPNHARNLPMSAPVSILQW